MNDYDNNERHNTMNDETTLGREHLDGNGTRWFASVARCDSSQRRSIHGILADGRWRSWADRDPALFSEETLKNEYAKFPVDVAVDWDSCSPWGGPCLFKRVSQRRRKLTVEIEYNERGRDTEPTALIDDWGLIAKVVKSCLHDMGCNDPSVAVKAAK